MEAATVRFGAPSAEREPNAEAGSISAPLLERGKQFLALSRARKALAFVLDLNEGRVRRWHEPVRHGTVRPRGLERVRQEIPTTAAKMLSIDCNRQFLLDRGNTRCEAAGVCLQCGGRFDLNDEVRHEDVSCSCRQLSDEPKDYRELGDKIVLVSVKPLTQN